MELQQKITLIISVFLKYFPCTAPSIVSIMHQVSRTIDSVTLSWSQPDQPNGVILDYELQYFEKVITYTFTHMHILHQGIHSCVALGKKGNWAISIFMKKSFDGQSVVHMLHHGCHFYSVLWSFPEHSWVELFYAEKPDEYSCSPRPKARHHLCVPGASSDSRRIWTLQWKDVLPNHDWRYDFFHK